MEEYDEDLNTNEFLMLLKSKYSEFLEKAIIEEWTVCVPQSAVVSVISHVPEDIFVHILVPTDSANHYLTLNDRKVVVKDKILYIHNDIADGLFDEPQVRSVNILFKETIYSDKKKKYKVICIDQSLSRDRNILTPHGISIVSLQSLRDCIYFLWAELGEKLIDKLHGSIQQFRVKNRFIEAEANTKICELSHRLFISVCALLNNVKNNTSMSNSVYYESLKLALEMYIQHNIYDGVMPGISGNMSYEDATFNKIIWGLDELQLEDLNISQFESCIEDAIRELSKIDESTNVLGKLKSIERSIDVVSKTSNTALTSDDMIPVLVYLIAKTGLPNWIAHLTFMKLFRFSSLAASSSDKYAFLLASFEAAIEHIKNGVILADNHSRKVLPSPDCQFISMEVFFYAIQFNDFDTVKSALQTSISEQQIPSRVSGDVCHPLCSCTRCSKINGLNFSSTQPSVNCNDKYGMTPLHVAALHGNVVIMEYLINRNADVNLSDFNGCTPLHLAAKKGHQNAILLLICSHACVNALDDHLNSVLHVCCNYGHGNCVKAILYYCEFSEIKIDIDAKNCEGDTPLHLAARWGYVDIVKILIEYNASIKCTNKRKQTPYEVTANPVIIDLINSADIIPHGYINIEVEGFTLDKHYPKNPFKFPFNDECLISEELQSIYVVKKIEKCFKAIERHDIKLVCYYLGLHESAKSEDIKLRELCHPLCDCENCIEISDTKPKILSNSILPINCSNLEEYTPLHMSILHEDETLIKLLLENGADMTIKTKKQGMTPLHIATQKGNLNMVKLLLNYGANPNERDLDGNTCLHYACIFNHQPLLEILFDYGTNLQYKNKFGLTPLDEASQRGFNSVVETLSVVSRVVPRF